MHCFQPHELFTLTGREKMFMRARFRNFITWIFCIAVGILASEAFAQPIGRDSAATKSLILRLNSAHWSAAQRFVEALNNPEDPENTLRALQARYPSKARFLLAERLPAETLATSRSSDPLFRLHRWIVLEYPTRAAAESARVAINANSEVIERAFPNSGGMSLAAVPDDPWYTITSTFNGIPDGNSSYSVHNFMGLFLAWDRVQGTAYVGVIDSGVQTIHSELLNTVRLHFSSNPVEEAPQNGRRGHGTFNAGIIAGGASNGEGTAGVCWNCSLMIMRVTDDSTGDPVCDSIVSQTYSAIAWGAQVLNMSFGLNSGCSTGPLEDVISFAASRQVTIVAAAGNASASVQYPSTQYPASSSYVISAGATNNAGSWRVWSATGKVDLAAPGEKIFSSFYVGSHWSTANLPYGVEGTKCDSSGNESSFPLNQYGWCSGTSVSSPLIAGAAALVRSANPLLSSAATKSALTAYANPYGQSSYYVGAGVPNVNDSVYNTLFGASGNGGLTPLFALLGGSPSNRFYTTVPQMASAAIIGTLKHGQIGYAGLSYAPSSAEGSTVSDYAFPGASGTPVAAVNVLTTINRHGRPTVPLHRFSYADYSLVAIHGYDNYVIPSFSGYVRDGIEGYLYSPYSPQPFGTVALMRKRNPGTGRWALFPGSQQSYFAGLGYTETVGGVETLGYVCPHPLPGYGICRVAQRTDETVIDWFYMEFLNRAADSGYGWWLDQLQNTRCYASSSLWGTLDWISSSFVNGTEFQNRGLSNQAFVSAMYRGLLRRDADSGGLSFYTGQLNSGAMTRDGLRATLLYSSEFYNATVAPVLGESCVP